MRRPDFAKTLVRFVMVSESIKSPFAKAMASDFNDNDDSIDMGSFQSLKTTVEATALHCYRLGGSEEVEVLCFYGLFEDGLGGEGVEVHLRGIDGGARLCLGGGDVVGFEIYHDKAVRGLQ